MPKPTQGEMLHELVKTVSLLEGKVESAKDKRQQLDKRLAIVEENVVQIRMDIAVLTERTESLTKQIDELKSFDRDRTTRLWFIIVATVGSGLTFLGNLALTFWRH